MPSRNQINNRRIAALQQIDDALGTSFTQIQERDNDIKVMKQVEGIAETLQSINLSPSVEIPQHYLDAEQLAREGATKAEIVDMLLGES